MRVFAYIVWDYKSAAEATKLRSEVASLAINHIGGGVGLYIGEHLNYKERHDLAFPEDKSAEYLFVEINRTKEKNVIVCIIYRPPDSKLNEFLSDLDLVWGKISKKNKLVF